MSESIPRYIGQSVPRREDKRLLQGQGLFVADIQFPNMLHVAIARSQLPHARIIDVDLKEARQMEGVELAISGQDILEHLPPISGMQLTTPPGYQERVDTDIEIPEQPLIPSEKVRFVGEPYALVVAESRYLAEDALELISPQLDPLPAIATTDDALDENAPILHEKLGRNIAAQLHTKKGKGAEGLKTAPHRLKRRFYHHRYAAMPMECRGVVADYDTRTDTLTIWSSTQVVHWVSREVANSLGMPEKNVRCIAPEVGG